MPIFPQRIADLTEVSPGVFYTKPTRDGFFLADEALLSYLKSQAVTAPLRRARVCAHPDAQAEQHDMLIASHRETYVAPHNHPKKTESLLILEGLVDILLFDDDGRPKERFSMGRANSGLPFMYRMPAGRFHSLIINTEVLLFMESTKGPFDVTQTTYADWAPAPDQIEAGRKYLAGLRHGQ